MLFVCFKIIIIIIIINNNNNNNKIIIKTMLFILKITFFYIALKFNKYYS